jgi:O-antigen ligase
MSAIAAIPVTTVSGALPVRRVAALAIVATLPLTYALTLPVGFPLKIYEVVLAGLLILAISEGRILLAPDIRRFTAPLGVFLAFITVVLVCRLAVRLDTFTISGFESRAGPVGDGVLKLGYWGLAIFAFVVVATATYENAERVARVWCMAAVVASIYAWLLTVTSALNLPSLLLPGMEGAARITLGGREVLRGGTFQEGNFFALYLLASLAVALWMKQSRIAWFLGATVFITFSTANVAGLAVMLGFLAFHRFRESRDVRAKFRLVATVLIASATLLSGLIATGYLGTIFVAKLSGAQFASGLDRLDLTVAGLRMTAAHPLIGVGIAQYGFNYRPFQLTDVFDVTRPVKPIATNSWVELTAETGALGTVLILAFGALLWGATRGRERRMLRAGLIAIGLGLFSFPAPTVTFLWGYFGFVAGLHLRDTRHIQTGSPS